MAARSADSGIIELNVNPDLSENLAYIQENFPLHVAESHLSEMRQYSAVAHWHYDLEFLWVVEGNLSYFVNGRTVDIGTGEGIFVNSSRLHYGFSKTMTECLYRCAVIDPKLLSENIHITSRWILPLIRGDDYKLLTPGNSDDARTLFLLDRMFRVSQERETGYELDILGLFAQVTAMMVRSVRMCERPRSQRDDAEFKAMFAYCQERFTDKLTIREIARAGAVCESKCTRLFRHFLDQSPIQYVRQLRIQKSIKMLLESDRNITEIALECGFSNPSYYAETFFQTVGVTPREFRRKYSGGRQDGDDPPD